MASLISRYKDRIQGVISCYDRIIIQGTLPKICYADGMTESRRSPAERAASRRLDCRAVR